MKVLSLKQPYAQLILEGRKKIELRKWNTKFRGEFLIHASQNPDKKSMESFGFDNLPCGMILGKANLVDVKKYLSEEDFENSGKEQLIERMIMPEEIAEIAVAIVKNDAMTGEVIVVDGGISLKTV